MGFLLAYQESVLRSSKNQCADETRIGAQVRQKYAKYTEETIDSVVTTITINAQNFINKKL